MSVVGRVESLWRYPVKSMRGEELGEAFVGTGGVRGDRVYAFHNSGAPLDFPYWTAREQGKMLLCRPVHKHAQDPAVLDVEAPGGDRLAIEDDRLTRLLREGARDGDEITLLKSEHALADCYPISLLSLQTLRRLSSELGSELDKRRFRANIYLDLDYSDGFAEDGFVGRRLQIGTAAIVAIIERDARCKMITLDPDTARPSPELMKLVAGAHEGKVGIYANVFAEGTVKPGDPVLLLDR